MLDRGLTSLPYLSDHRILGTILLPATAFLEIACVAEAAASGAPGEPEITGNALLAELASAGSERLDTPGATLSSGVRVELRVGTEPERLARIVSYLKNRSAAVLHLQPDLLDVDKKINHLGMDSLTVMQLRNALKADLEVDVPAVDFFGYPTVVQLAAMVLARLAEAPAATPSTVSPPERLQPEAGVQVDQLTDEEVEAMLHDLMEGK